MLPAQAYRFPSTPILGASTLELKGDLDKLLARQSVPNSASRLRVGYATQSLFLVEVLFGRVGRV